jgi:transcriptional regulator with XRE-family HTH domain
MTIQELFIDNLKKHRKLKRISQMALAEKCNSAQTYIAEIETGKKFPSPEMIERIAAALEIESWRLFQNAPVNDAGTADIKKLLPSDRLEIARQLYNAAVKIVDQF